MKKKGSMKKIVLGIIFALTALSTISAYAQSTPPLQTYFSLDSTPQSWVGHGQPVFVDSLNNTFGVSTSPGNTLSVNIRSPNGSYWYLDFAAPGGQQLAVGTYENATRWPFNGSGPGLSLTGNGRGDNTLTGSFTVSEIAFVDGKVSSAAINFTQFDEGISTWRNDGVLRINSAFPATVPEPSIIALLVIGIGIYATKRLRTL